MIKILEISTVINNSFIRVVHAIADLNCKLSVLHLYLG